MFDIYSLRQLKRSTFSNFGIDDRTQWFYRSDLSNKYNRPDAGMNLEKFFTEEFFGQYFDNQNTSLIDEKYLDAGIELVNTLYKSVFGNNSSISAEIIKKIAIDSLLQAKLLNDNLKNDNIVEFGPGLGFASIFYFNFYLKKDKTIRYYLTDAIEPLLVLQQRFLSSYLMMNDSIHYISNLDLEYINQCKKNLIVHIPLWDINKYSFPENSTFFASRFFENIAESDFDKIFNFLSKYKNNKKSTFIFWGGLERSNGGPALYLFNFGSFINKNIPEILLSFSNYEIKKFGSEYLFISKEENNIDKEVGNLWNIIFEEETKYINSVFDKDINIITDDNSPFLDKFKEVTKLNLCSYAYSTSVATHPLPLDLQRKPLKELDVKKPTLLFSYRWKGLLKVLQDNFPKKDFVFHKISEKIIYIEGLKK